MSDWVATYDAGAAANGGLGLDWDWASKVACRSLHVKYFLHHRELFSWLQPRHGLEQFPHLLLPFQIGWVLVERAPHGVKVIDLHDQEQILISPEDGVFGNTDFFQFG
jgi:hypothetical protein